MASMVTKCGRSSIRAAVITPSSPRPFPSRRRWSSVAPVCLRWLRWACGSGVIFNRDKGSTFLAWKGNGGEGGIIPDFVEGSAIWASLRSVGGCASRWAVELKFSSHLLSFRGLIKFRTLTLGPGSYWRRGWDSNPRSLAAQPVFKTAAIDHSATSPKKTGKTLPEVDPSIGSAILGLVQEKPALPQGSRGGSLSGAFAGEKYKSDDSGDGEHPGGGLGEGSQVSTPSLENANWPASVKEKMFWSERCHVRLPAMVVPGANVRKVQLCGDVQNGFKRSGTSPADAKLI